MVGETSSDSLIDLFDLLARRALVGNQAKSACLTFLLNEGIVSHDGIEHPELLDVFLRLLDRNLTAGFGVTTLKAVRWDEAQTQSLRAGEGSKPTKTKAKSAPAVNKVKAMSPSRIANLDSFSCPLGKAVDPPFSELFHGKVPRWFASRKLDGVRCLTFVDILVPHQGDPEVKDIHFMSRSGNEFTSLDKLEHQLRKLGKWPGLAALLARDPSIVSEEVDGEIKRIVLDGEVCVMRPMREDERSIRQEHDDGSVAADSLWVHDGLTEDFAATVSQVKRKNTTVQHPAYFLFDAISWAEFAALGPVGVPGLSKPFGQRVQDIEEIGIFLAKQEHPLIRALAQKAVTTREDLDGMIQRAADEGWEGLIFRADLPYKGKRSRDILKFKKWKDAEYTVVSAHNSTMRLAVDGTYEEREACANVIVEHNGHPVSVGSGFSAEQRLRFARDPGEIVGKQITVEYFGESEAADRPGVMSLRFPRVKVVWEEGPRAI